MDQDDLPDPSGPYKPIWARPGNTLLDTWTEDFEDRIGNKAILTMFRFRNKKGKTIETVGHVKWVHFVDLPLSKRI